MSDKTLVKQTPEIREQIAFIAAIKEGREQVRCGQIVSLNQVEKKISSLSRPEKSIRSNS